MTKVLKDTIKKIERKPSLRIFKKDTSKNYYCSFYVGRDHMKSGTKELSLRTANVKDALKIAQETYDKTMRTLPEVAIVDFEKDIAQPFFKVRVRKYTLKGKVDNDNQGVRERSRYNNYIRMFFDKVDYRNQELLSNAVADLTNHLKLDNKTDNTISKYMSVLNMMFHRAQNQGVMKSLPDMPSLAIINKPRQSYFNEELNQITKRLQELSDETKNTNAKEFLEVKDYLNLIRSAGFRPGIQPLMIKNFQYSYLTDKENPSEPILKFVLFNTKTSPKHTLTCHPYFTKNIFPEIVSRNPNSKAEDYLLFPKIKNRKSLYARISKLFVRVSSELGLYHRHGENRPLYSVRHTFISGRYNANAPLEVVARSSNTSVKIVKKNYLDNEDTMMINEHKRLFPKKKK